MNIFGSKGLEMWPEHIVKHWWNGVRCVYFHVLSLNPVLKHAMYLEGIEGRKLSSDIFRT